MVLLALLTAKDVVWTSALTLPTSATVSGAAAVECATACIGATADCQSTATMLAGQNVAGMNGTASLPDRWL